MPCFYKLKAMATKIEIGFNDFCVIADALDRNARIKQSALTESAREALSGGKATAVTYNGIDISLKALL